MAFDFQSQTEKASVLLEALPYLQQFRGKTFLIKIGGSAMDNRELVKLLLRDVVFLEIAGINPVLVHGGGKAISAAMKESGLDANFINGMRFTTDESMQIVEATLSSSLNPSLAADIENYGGKSLGIPGNTVFIGERITTKVEGKDVDLGRVGKVIDFELDQIEAAIKENTVPVVSPIAKEAGTGLSLNVNADLAASALAARLKAAKLVYLSDVLGVMEDQTNPDSLIHSIKADDVEGMISSGIIGGGMIPKVRSSVEALHAGVEKVHMIDGRVSHTLLLEIFTQEGIGTEIVK